MAEVTLKNVLAVLERYGETVRDEYRKALDEGGKNASHNLWDSVSFEVNAEEGRYQVVLELASYWKYVEYGRKPGGRFPPIPAIEKWIRVKPVVPRPDRNGRVPSVPQLAFLIARSIAENGIAPTNALATASAKTYETFREEIAGAFVRDIGTDDLDISFFGSEITLGG